MDYVKITVHITRCDCYDYVYVCIIPIPVSDLYMHHRDAVSSDLLQHKQILHNTCIILTITQQSHLSLLLSLLSLTASARRSDFELLGAGADPLEGAAACSSNAGYSLQGGAVGGGVQRMGVVFYNKLVYHTI